MWGLMSLFVLPQLVHRMPEMWGPTGHSLAAVRPSSRSPLPMSVTTCHDPTKHSTGYHTTQSQE